MKKRLKSGLVFFMLLLAAGGNSFAQDTITVVLHPAQPGRSIPADYAGLSFEINALNRALFAGHKDTLVQLFRTAGIQSLRIGGNSADKDTFSTVASKTRFTRAELDSFFVFSQKAGCKVLMGLNCGGSFNPSLASTQVAYVMQHYAPSVWGFEVGNEPDLYASNGFRPSTYHVAAYEQEYQAYADTIHRYTPSAVFTGPAAASQYIPFTLPFCRAEKGRSAMLTQHYYVAAAGSAPIHQQVVKLLSAAKLNGVVSEVSALTACADSAGIPFRMAECNSFYNGGQWGVSDAFASSLWALDYMYALAAAGCSGVNFHGALGGPYTAISRRNSIYYAQPLYYGILAFQAGSHGQFIPAAVTNNQINLNCYAVMDAGKTVFTTVVNKDTLKNAFIRLDAGTSYYNQAAYITLSATSLTDTLHVSLGGQTVQPDGKLQAFTWSPLSVAQHQVLLEVPAGSAAVIRFGNTTANGIANNRKTVDYSISPNPSDGIFLLECAAQPGPDLFVDIYDLQGRILLSAMLKEKRTRIDLSNLTSGSYLLYVRKNDLRCFSTRLIKTR